MSKQGDRINRAHAVERERMSESKHTPRLWEVGEDGGDVFCGDVPIARTSQRWMETASIRQSPSKEERFNARLIAAAPKLLEAAKAALAVLETLHYTDAQRQLVAAIAEAEDRNS